MSLGRRIRDRPSALLWDAEVLLTVLEKCLKRYLYLRVHTAGMIAGQTQSVEKAIVRDSPGLGHRRKEKAAASESREHIYR